MYEIGDTIAAVSSPTGNDRTILRLTGPMAFAAVEAVIETSIAINKRAVYPAKITIDNDLAIEAFVYKFIAPKSYTGENLVEIHFDSNESLTSLIIGKFFAEGLRLAKGGEFTARAYLNGKLDLAQAEAVGEIIASSNRLQLGAAEKLLAGNLGKIVNEVSCQLLDLLSLIEAGLDFATEQIDFIESYQAIDRLNSILDKLDDVAGGSISCEVLMDLPSVAVAGCPNAGKSTLANCLIGSERNIVSPIRKTTRDVIAQQISFDHCNAVLFDCAGLICQAVDVIDRLSQNAAIGVLNKADVVLFCVDLSKEDVTEDLAVKKMIGNDKIFGLATKCDLIDKPMLTKKLERLTEKFGFEFIAISSQNYDGIEKLKEAIDQQLINLTAIAFSQQTDGVIAITARHRQAVDDARDSVTEVIEQIELGNQEVAAMMIRAAFMAISTIGRDNVDEKVLDKIFSQFCIGK